MVSFQRGAPASTFYLPSPASVLPNLETMYSSSIIEQLRPATPKRRVSWDDRARRLLEAAARAHARSARKKWPVGGRPSGRDVCASQSVGTRLTIDP